MMNYNFVRRLTSSIFASLFALSVGVVNVKPVNSQEVENTKTCQTNASKFNIPLADKHPLKVAVINSADSLKSKVKPNNPSPTARPTEYEFKGLGDILAGKLSEDSNFSVTDWNQIKPVSENQTNLKELRKLRDEYGIEAVLFVTVNEFQVNGTKARNYYLFGKNKQFNDVYVTLNFRLVDTLTGNIIDSGKGEGHENKSYTSKITTPTITVGDIKLNQNVSWKPTITIKFDSQNQIFTNTQEGIEKKLLAVAVEGAINQLIEDLSTNSNQASCLLRIPTMIADIDENQVIISKGKLHGYCEGMTLSVERSPKAIIDPYSGRFLLTKTKPIPGIQIEIIEVKPHYSIGKITYTSGKVLTKVLFAKRQLFAKLIPSKEDVCSTNQTEEKSTQNPTIPSNLKTSKNAKDLQPRNNSPQS
ncbi:MAG: CsgG/HfaB family protein [Cyanobacteria bacterium J06633_8]